MPEPDVLIMTLNRCVAVDQWESARTTKLYNPNMKVEIVAIPPRKDPGDVCCKFVSPCELPRIPST